MEDFLHFQIAYNAAIGHIDTGLNQYKKLESLSKNGAIAGNVFEVAIPAVTNLTLGLELLLKFHHFQVSEKIPRGHNIKKLGESLPEEKLDFLRRHYESLYKDQKYDKGIEVLFSDPKSKKEKIQIQAETYDQAIEYIGEMYVEWRYIYEKFGVTTNIAVSFMPIWFVIQSVNESIKSHKGNVKITMSF